MHELPGLHKVMSDFWIPVIPERPGVVANVTGESQSLGKHYDAPAYFIVISPTPPRQKASKNSFQKSRVLYKAKPVTSA